MDNGKSSQAVHQYKKVQFNASEIPMDAPAGEWEFTAVRGKTTVKPIQSGASAGYPMVTFQLRIDGAAETENEAYKGTQLPFRITIVSDNDGAIPGWMKRRAKLQLRALADACGFDLDIIPNNISGEEDLAAFINAVEGNTFTGYTTASRREGWEHTVDVSLTKPGAFGAASAGATPSRDEEEEEDETPVAKRATKKSSKR
jgi:hypothetical protein